MDDVSLKELIACWKFDERSLSHRQEQRLIMLAVAEVERLQAALRDAAEMVEHEQDRTLIYNHCTQAAEAAGKESR